MNATRIFGIVAALSGAALLAVIIVSGATGALGGISSFGTSTGGWQTGTGMMGGVGMGPGMMGTGTGTIGSGMGPGMMYGWGGTTGGTTGAAIPGAPEVRVTASEFALTPAEIVLPAGTAVNLTLVNSGALTHDLTIPALGVRIVAAPGQTQTVGLQSLAAGSYPAYCSIGGHAAAGMRATVVVK